MRLASFWGVKLPVKPITWRQFDWLMSGLEIEQPKAIKSAGNA
jgi:transposase